VGFGLVVLFALTMNAAHAQSCPAGSSSSSGYVVTAIEDNFFCHPSPTVVGKFFSSPSAAFSGAGITCANPDIQLLNQRFESPTFRADVCGSGGCAGTVGVRLDAQTQCICSATNAAPVNGQCPATCAAGSEGGWALDDDPLADTLCKQGCGFTADRKIHIAPPVDSTIDDLYKAHYVGTGQTCGADTGTTQDEPGPAPTQAGDYTPSGGGNCGTLNGETICPEPTGTGQCTQLSSGGVFCVASNDPAVSSDTLPNNGTPGTQAPGTTVTNQSTPTGGSTTTTTTTIFNQSTFANATNVPPPRGNTNGNGNGTGSGQTCGGPGQVPCNVNVVNGSGTGAGGPTFNEPDGEYGFDDLQEEIAQARQRMAEEFQTIRGEAADVFGTLPGGAAGLPVYTITTQCCGTHTLNLAADRKSVV
jgi:hypothetical protein